MKTYPCKPSLGTSILLLVLAGCIPDRGRPYLWDTAEEDTEAAGDSDTATDDTDTGPGESGETQEELDPDLVDEGRIVFFTINEEGCAKCHGADAKGLGGCPNIIGKSRVNIVNALETIDQMQVLNPTEHEIDAVSAYLMWLKENG